jgi:hypothetical protein
VNVALVSLTEWICYRIAVQQRLFWVPPARVEMMTNSVCQLVPPGVFVASIAITLLVGPTAGRISWLSLLVLGPPAGRWATKRVAMSGG